MTGKFSTEHWKDKAKPMTQDNNKVTDVNGATEILGVSRATIIRWEQEEVIKSFKSIFNGRMRKCFLVSELEKLAGQGDEVSA